MKSAAKVLAAAVFNVDDNSRELTLNKTSKLDECNSNISYDKLFDSQRQHHQQKLLSFFNSAGHMSLEELIKVLVTAIKEAGGLHTTNNSSDKANVKLPSIKASIRTENKESPEEVLQRKRQQVRNFYCLKNY